MTWSSVGYVAIVLIYGSNLFILFVQLRSKTSAQYRKDIVLPVLLGIVGILIFLLSEWMYFGRLDNPELWADVFLIMMLDVVFQLMGWLLLWLKRHKGQGRE